MTFKLPKELGAVPVILSKKQDIINSLPSMTLPEQTIYLDSASTTPLDLRIFHAMTPWMLEYFGNPANRLHPMGEVAEYALSEARQSLANLFQVKFEEIFFTSSATESNNLILRGLLSQTEKKKRKKYVYCATEHSSVISTLLALRDEFNIEIAELPVDHNGHILIERALEIIDHKTICVSIMDVNNETGVLQPDLSSIAEHCHHVGAYLHVDSVQGFAKTSLLAQGVDYDFAVINAHKIYGPKGISALFIKSRRPRIHLTPQLTGGGQEYGLRSSTQNLPAIIGLQKACELQFEEKEQRLSHYKKLESLFISTLKKKIDSHFYALEVPRAPGIFMLRFDNVNAMKLIENSKRVCIGTGSACRTLQATASHVLNAMGVDLDASLASFRVSFGMMNTEEDILLSCDVLAATALQLRKESAFL